MSLDYVVVLFLWLQSGEGGQTIVEQGRTSEHDEVGVRTIGCWDVPLVPVMYMCS
jgi:hypothetical protein